MLTSREHIENLVSVRAEETLFRRAYITLFTHQLLHSFAFMKAMKWHPDKNPDNKEQADRLWPNYTKLVSRVAPLHICLFWRTFMFLVGARIPSTC